MENKRKAKYSKKLSSDYVSLKNNKKEAVKKDFSAGLKIGNFDRKSKDKRLKNIQSNSVMPVLREDKPRFVVNSSLNDEIKRLESLTEKNLNLKYNWLDIEKRLIEINISKKLKPIFETKDNRIKCNNSLENLAN